jgi:hypothetical protein
MDLAEVARRRRCRARRCITIALCWNAIRPIWRRWPGRAGAGPEGRARQGQAQSGAVAIDLWRWLRAARTLAAAINSAQTPAVAQAQAPAQRKVVSADATQPPVPISKN